jgi:hypothetical protein
MATNMSDRGGANRFDAKSVFVEDGTPSASILDPRLDDIRRLTGEDIAELGERYGRERVAGEIAARAAVQMTNVKLTVDHLPEGERLRRVGDDSDLTADDVDWLNARRLQQAKAQHVHRELQGEALRHLYADLMTIVGEETDTVVRRLGGDAAFLPLLRVPKKERRKALAKMLAEAGV